MKAVVCTKYGPPEVLIIQDVPKPLPKNDEILVKIIATSVSSGDVRVRGLAVKGIMRIVMRIVLGFFKPRKPVLGTAYAGIVVKTGRVVSQFKEGDRVFGMSGFKFGAYAEYICVKQNSNVISMPANASFEEAAALIFGGQTADYFLTKMKIRKIDNPKVLIIGATGSVGIGAIQIAKYYNAEITAVCSSRGNDLVNKLGVFDVIHYDKEEFTLMDKKFDLILDAVGHTCKIQCRHLLKEKGVYKNVNGTDYASETKEQLDFLKDLFENGQLQAVIDRVFPLDKIVDAHRYVETGRKKGDVILKVCES